MQDKKSLNATSKGMKKIYEEDLKETTKYLKNNYGSDVIIHHKMSYPYFSRRIRAYSNYADYIHQKYGDSYDYIDIYKELSFIGSLPFVTNLDILNNLFNVSIAIAIYILDLLNDNGKLSEAIVYIPSEKQLLEKIDLPENFNYPTYSNDLIKGVTYLIEHCSQGVSLKHGYRDIFYTEFLAGNNMGFEKQPIELKKHSQSHIQSMNCEQRLKCMISFIPSSILLNIEKHFKEIIDHCTYLLLSEFNYIEREKSVEHCENNNLNQSSDYEKFALKLLSIYNFIDKNKACAFNAIKSRKDRLMIANPYELFFAIFYLLEYKNDDYAWLVELCGIVGEFACNMLPWYQHPDFSSQNEIMYQYINVNTLNYIYYNSWDGNIDYKADSTIIKETLCKIVYRKDGCILPQNNSLLRKVMFMNKGLLNILLELGIYIFTAPFFVLVIIESVKRGNEPIPVALAVIILILVVFRKNLQEINRLLLKKVLRKLLVNRITRQCKIDFPQCASINKSSEEYEKEIEEIRSTVAIQKDEIKNLKLLLYESSKTLDSHKAQYDGLKAEYDLNIEELVELRESIYKMQNSTKLEVELQECEPQFPYNTKKKILIVGGHEKWINSMKQYIPNATYINPSTLNFESGFIKNFDVIWLQTNAMPHSLYYKMIDVIRCNKISTKYFVYPSARKCATQIYTFELSKVSVKT